MMATKVIIKNNGPIRLEGEFELFDENGNQFNTEGKTAISLCRCGQSSKSPFCDGTHKSCGFSSTVEAA
ncbi:MAG: CDGSH iron-sulfur domain-containing protein [Candidatus Kapaibacterium sp.]|nr:MAG: CDGSH iron-sulfur domain-containing protein [Candidatus Kapabacteria bacterium]